MDFSFVVYQQIIRSGLSRGYLFKTFKHIREERSTAKIIYLRHDIDIDMGAALKMAKVEHELGVRSTYFIMLRSPIYNLLSRENSDLCKEIIQLGHEIGLHYDQGYYNSNKGLNELVEEEVRILQYQFGITISSVSFHQPGKDVLENNVKLNNLINSYDKVDMQGIYYLSDSNMQFNRDPVKLIENGEQARIQLLIHPIWWGRPSEYLTTEHIWNWGLIEAFERAQRQILATERAFGNRREFIINYDNKK